MFRSYHDEQYCFIIILLSSIAFSPIKYAFSSILSLVIKIPYHLDSISLWILFIGIYIFPVISKIHITKSIILIPAVISAYIFLFILFHLNYTKEALTVLYKTLIRAYPYFIIAFQIRDFELLKKYLRKAGYLITISCLIVIIIKLYLGTMERYDMSLSYMVFPAVIICFWYLIEDITLCNVLFFVLSFLEMIFLGTRGPILCFGLFFIYLIFRVSFHAKRDNVLIVISIIITAFLFIILIFGSTFFQQIAIKSGLSLRVFTAVTEGEFFKSSGRIIAYMNSFKLLIQNPILGTGILNDRFLLSYLNNGYVSDNFLGSYSHMIFLELLVQFGVVVGSILCMYLIYKIAKLLIAPRNSYKDCGVIFMFIGIVPLFLSESYLQQASFYIFLAFISSAFKNKVFANV